MACARRVCEEGSLLEHAIRGIRMGRPESAWDLRRKDGRGGEEVVVTAMRGGGGGQGCEVMKDGGYWKIVELGGKGGEKVVVGAVGLGQHGQGSKLLQGGGSWEAVKFREAASVVNPVAKKLVSALWRRAIKVHWVRETVWRRDQNREISVDVVLAVEGDGGRQDYWWVEVKWTRGDHEDKSLRVVEEGWKKVKEFQQVMREIEAWHLLLAGREAFKSQRMGLIVVSPRGLRLELVGDGLPMLTDIFENDGSGAAENATEVAEVVGEKAESRRDGEGGEYGEAFGSMGGDGGEFEGGGGDGEGGASEDEDEVEEARAVLRRPGMTAREKANKRWKDGKGYNKVLEFRLGRMKSGGDGGGTGRRTRSAGTAEFEGVTKIGRKRK